MICRIDLGVAVSMLVGGDKQYLLALIGNAFPGIAFLHDFPVSLVFQQQEEVGIHPETGHQYFDFCRGGVVFKIDG